jgi:hypothetical protein
MALKYGSKCDPGKVGQDNPGRKPWDLTKSKKSALKGRCRTVLHLYPEIPLVIRYLIFA